jgi:hypothetical protein
MYYSAGYADCDLLCTGSRVLRAELTTQRNDAEPRLDKAMSRDLKSRLKKLKEIGIELLLFEI